jgi:hypothetical protein
MPDAPTLTATLSSIAVGVISGAVGSSIGYLGARRTERGARIGQALIDTEAAFKAVIFATADDDHGAFELLTKARGHMYALGVPPRWARAHTAIGQAFCVAISRGGTPEVVGEERATTHPQDAQVKAMQAAMVQIQVIVGDYLAAPFAARFKNPAAKSAVIRSLPDGTVI